MNRNICFACLGLVCGLAVAQLAPSNVASVSAQTGGQTKCDYTFIQDGGEPNIGKEGEIKYNEPWTRVLEAGWTLKATSGQGAGALYIFEKCR